MGRKPKYSKEIKIKACKDYIAGKGSFNLIAKNIGCSETRVREWYHKYLVHGGDAFNYSNENRTYTHLFKEAVVSEYISREYSNLDLASKYNIAPTVISKWIKNHYNGIENKDYDPKGEVYTMESRKTTYEERLEIVEWVISNDMNYKVAAEKNGVKYALVYQWVQKYLKNGAEGLKHKKRGPKDKTIIDEDTLSEVQRLKLEIEREKALREQAEFRLELFKKKEEFAEKRRFRK